MVVDDISSPIIIHIPTFLHGQHVYGLQVQHIYCPLPRLHLFASLWWIICSCMINLSATGLVEVYPIFNLISDSLHSHLHQIPVIIVTTMAFNKRLSTGTWPYIRGGGGTPHLSYTSMLLQQQDRLTLSGHNIPEIRLYTQSIQCTSLLHEIFLASTLLLGRIISRCAHLGLECYWQLKNGIPLLRQNIVNKIKGDRTKIDKTPYP